MAFKSKSLIIPTPSRGINIRDSRFPSEEQATSIINMRLDKYGKLVRRPGFKPYNTKFDFDALPFYGLHPYYDVAKTQRILTINNNKIVEFNPNAKNDRVTALTGTYGQFLNALSACYFCNSKENKKGYGAIWTDFGVAGPIDAATLTQNVAGGGLSDGVYKVRYSYVVKDGASRLLISAHDYEASITVNGGGATQKITTTIRRSTNSRVTHIIVWCTAINGSKLYLSSEIANAGGGVFVDVDITANVDISGLCYSTYEHNQGPPGAFKWMNFNDARIWAIPVSDPTNIYPSARGTHYDLEYFPTDNLVNMSKSGLPLNFCFALVGNEYAMTRSETYVLDGADINGISKEIARIGTENPWSWTPWEAGLIGLTNRGIEFFDGYKFTMISDDIYPLVNADDNKLTSQGIVINDAEYGQRYFYLARIAGDVAGSVNELPGFLPGSGTGGSGIGLPSDNFDDNVLNATRWAETADPQFTIAETGGKLQFTRSGVLGTSAHNPFEQLICTINQNICLKVDVAITSVTSADYTISHYMELRYDANNYIQVGLSKIIGLAQIYAWCIITINGITVTGIDAFNSNVNANQTSSLMIRLYHNKIEAWFLDKNGAWTDLAAAFDSSLSATGWTVRFAVQASTAEEFPANPDFVGTFDNFRCQYDSASGTEDITPEELSDVNTNVDLVCTLKAWQPGIYDDESKAMLQPAWSIETIMAQRMTILEDGAILFLDNVTGKCYELDPNEIFDNQEYIACLIESRIIDLDIKSKNKYLGWAKVVGNWGMPFKMAALSIPDLYKDEVTISGYGGGTQMNLTQMQSNALANTEHVYETVKFAKHVGNGNKLLIKKMDPDPIFSIEEIFTEVKYNLGKYK